MSDFFSYGGGSGSSPSDRAAWASPEYAREIGATFGEHAVLPGMRSSAQWDDGVGSALTFFDSTDASFGPVGIGGFKVKKLRKKLGPKAMLKNVKTLANPKKAWRKTEKQFKRSAPHLAAVAPVLGVINPALGAVVGAAAGARMARTKRKNAQQELREAEELIASDALRLDSTEFDGYDLGGPDSIPEPEQVAAGHEPVQPGDRRKKPKGPVGFLSKVGLLPLLAAGGLVAFLLLRGKK